MHQRDNRFYRDRSIPDATFFMVLSDRSNVTNVRHATLDIARTEARRLAGLNPGIKFFVLASLGHMIKEDPVSWKDHDTRDELTDEIPF